ncbi:LysR family transcriptional regulator [bacterium]|nr:LysR family transcriptional regulator [bacterium]
MLVIIDMQFSDIDLNLLVLLDQALELGSLSRAAEKLNISQPAASRLLARLRRTLGDPLLIPSGRRTIFSQRAESMRQPLRLWLQQAEQLLQPPIFEPARYRGAWRLYLLDYLSLVVLPQLVAHLQQRAPGLDLIVPPNIPNAFESLRRGELDLALGFFPELGDEFQQHHLFEERFVCLTRLKHPALRGGKISLDDFCQLSHALITTSGSGLSPVDEILRQRGLSRRVALRLPHFLAAPLVVAQTDLILTLPTRVAEVMAGRFPLQLSPPPLPLQAFPISQVWHCRSHHDPAQIWLRQQLQESLT